MKPARAKTPARTPGVSARLARLCGQGESEEVAVFCRVRPLGSEASDEDEERCVEATDENTLRVAPPESARAFYAGRGADYTFRLVFNEDASQREVFQECGLPLVRQLLRGKNGLLFTYGVTGSGKTYTMQGTPMDGGLMSRAVDVLFNSLEGRLTSRKYVVESDKLNDFQIQSVADAAAKQQQEMVSDMKSRAYQTRSNASDQNLSNRLPDETIIEDLDKNKVYAVFISYCEIYNKYIYDLLEDTRDCIGGKHKFESKSLREDAHGNMFVYGATEKEVRSPREALELFYKGQKRRRVAQTQLNFESSRSHSIFNIRLVKCSPADEDEIDDEKPCLVSQLALVDLAGSERTSRTGNTGDRLREAGNINNSLMNLRTCIERLRENQKTGKTGNVPYRNDKITHLFRNYFEGIGSVKMIVNVNPRASDYEETVNVLQFAEMAQEVEIDRFDPVMRNFAVTPSRQRAQEAFAAALRQAETGVDANKLNSTYSPIYSLGPNFPSVEWQGSDDDDTLPALERYLEQRIATRNTLLKDHAIKKEQFRQRLVDSEKELILLREENARLKAGWEGEKRRTRDLETRLVNAESANTSLQRRIEAFCDAKVVLENELDEKEIELNQQKKETKKIVRQLRKQKSSGEANSNRDPPVPRKRSYELRGGNDGNDDDGGFKGVGSRIAEMEARCSKKLKR